MDARLVTVAREISSLNANIIRSRLEAEGVQCFVSGEAASSVVGLPANVGAFIDVQVLDFDAARAHSILQEIEESSREEGGEKNAQIPRVNLLADLAFRLLVSAFFSLIGLVIIGVLTGGFWFTFFGWSVGLPVGIGMFVVLSIVSVTKTLKVKRKNAEHDYDN